MWRIAYKIEKYTSGRKRQAQHSSHSRKVVHVVKEKKIKVMPLGETEHKRLTCGRESQCRDVKSEGRPNRCAFTYARKMLELMLANGWSQARAVALETGNKKMRRQLEERAQATHLHKENGGAFARK